MVDDKATYISALTFTMDAKDVPRFGAEAAQLVQRRGAGAPGFIESVVMVDETKTQVLIVTQWQSQQAWVQINWDRDVGNELTALVEGAKSFNVRSFDPIAVVHADPRG